MEGSHLKCGKKEPPGPTYYPLSSSVESILSQAAALSKPDYDALFYELAKRAQWNEREKKTAKNFIVDLWKKTPKFSSSSGGKRQDGCNGQRRNVDPSPPGAISGTSNPQTGTSLEDATSSKSVVPSLSASEVSIICQGDLIAKKDLFFLDVEKIIASKTHENLAADISVVDIRGRLVFWAFIKRDEVCRFNKQMTGLNAQKMQKGVQIEMVQELFEKLFFGKTIWGADVRNDWISLGYLEGKPSFVKSCDIQDFYRDHRNQPIGLSHLSKHFLGEDMQEGVHSPITDARITAICYRRMIQFQQMGQANFNCNVFQEFWETTAKTKGGYAFEKCNCGAEKTAKKKNKNENRSLHQCSLLAWNIGTMTDL